MDISRESWRQDIGQMQLPNGEKPAALVLNEQDYDRFYKSGYLDPQQPSGGDYYHAPKLNETVVFDSAFVPSGRIVLISQRKLEELIARLKDGTPIDEALNYQEIDRTSTDDLMMHFLKTN